MIAAKHKEFKFLIKLNRIGHSSHGHLSMVAIAFEQLSNTNKQEDATPSIASEQHARQSIIKDKNSKVIEINDDVPLQSFKTKTGGARSNASKLKTQLKKKIKVEKD